MRRRDTVRAGRGVRRTRTGCRDGGRRDAWPSKSGTGARPRASGRWCGRSRRSRRRAAHTALVVKSTWDEADWAELEEKARVIVRAGWWIDERGADSADLLELLDAAGEADRGTENPFR